MTGALAAFGLARVLWLHNPLSVIDAALLLVTLGVLLIEVECLLPGRVVAGACGLLSTLVGVHRLALLPLRGTALLLSAAGAVLLGLSVLRRLRLPAAIAGTALLSAGAATLGGPAETPRPSVPGLLAGLVLGISVSFLLDAAARARRNKRIFAEPRLPTLRRARGMPE